MTKRYRFFVNFKVAALLVCALLLAGAGSPEQENQPRRRDSQSTQQPPPRIERSPSDRGPEVGVSDRQMEDWIVVALAARSSFRPGMQVAVSDGIPSISGTVPTIAARNRALRAVHSVTEGPVQDRLTVGIRSYPEPPRSGPDLSREIARNIAKRISGAKAGEDWWFAGWRVEGPYNLWNLTVESDQPGHVVLDGDVPIWNIMRIAIEAAASVPGVRVVESDLEFEPQYYPRFRYGTRYYPGRHPYSPLPYGPPYGPYGTRESR